MKRALKIVGLALLVILIGIQFVPVNRTNPPVTREIRWNAPQTKSLAQRACFACHSNETLWPAYSYIAPLSFRVIGNVNEGRSKLNFSEWDQPNAEFDEVSENITQGSMPPQDYLLLHAEAKLTSTETQQLLDGLEATFQQDPPVDDEDDKDNDTEEDKGNSNEDNKDSVTEDDKANSNEDDKDSVTEDDKANSNEDDKDDDAEDDNDQP